MPETTLVKPVRLVSARQLAERLGQSADSINRHRITGLITGYKVGPRAVRYDLDEALAALVKPMPNPRDTKTAPCPKAGR
jgi:hypothetical protein